MDGYQSAGKLRRPILASFGQEVEEIPDRRIEVYASVVWVVVWAGVKRGFGGIKMMDVAVTLPWSQHGVADSADRHSSGRIQSLHP